MNQVVDTKAVLSSVVTHMKYAKHKEDQNRREVWSEITDRSAQMHINKFPHMKADVLEAFSMVAQKRVLQSMRSAQFAGNAIETKNNRMYNCAYNPIDSVDSITETFYNLLCGSGVGYSVQNHHVARIPRVVPTTKDTFKDFTVPDSIEGWCQALQHLFKVYTGAEGQSPHRPRFLLHLIRPEGAPLKTSGGSAPGPEPLRLALTRIEVILRRNLGKKLGSLALHDCLCLMADAVHSGGIRRAAMIAFFDRDDMDMLTCKRGEWAGSMVHGVWVPGKFEDGYNPQRGRANNSAVFVRGETTFDDFWQFWQIVQENGTGEPGIYWTWDRNILANPCVEIALHPHQFCNLTTVNGADVTSEADFIQRVIMASRIGTLQAAYTDFPFLRSVWQETTAREALLGVSITGIGAGRLAKFNLKKAALAAVAENKRVAKLLGINQAARVTCIKPEGTGSLVLGTPAGIHSWHNPYYWRTIRVGKAGKDGALYNYLTDVVPDLIEDEKGKEDTHAVFRVPVQANPEGYFRQNETAIDLLERVKRYNQHWITPGHQGGTNKHNISCTVSIRQDEWEAVGRWMWDNKQFYNGLAVLPYFGGNYRQAPFSDCDEAEFKRYAPLLNKINITDVEETESTGFAGASACSGPICEL